MNASVKKILEKAGVYFFLQGNYRRMLLFLKKLQLRNRFSKYKGTGYTCNFCGRSYKRFAPRYPSVNDAPALNKYNVIAGKGENVYCPFCMSTSRERLLLKVLKDRFELNDKIILHISPEKKIYNYINRFADVITADISPGFYKNIDKNVRLADATHLPFENECFDIVVGNHIMEHIPKDLLAMQEIYRVLKKGGRAILQVPFSESIPTTIEEPSIKDPAKQSELFGQKDHVRIYSISDYISRLRKTGFTVNYITPGMLDGYNKYATQAGEGFIDIIK